MELFLEEELKRAFLSVTFLTTDELKEIGAKLKELCDTFEQIREKNRDRIEDNKDTKEEIPKVEDEEAFIKDYKRDFKAQWSEMVENYCETLSSYAHVASRFREDLLNLKYELKHADENKLTFDSLIALGLPMEKAFKELFGHDYDPNKILIRVKDHPRYYENYCRGFEKGYRESYKEDYVGYIKRFVNKLVELKSLSISEAIDEAFNILPLPEDLEINAEEELNQEYLYVKKDNPGKEENE